MKNHIIVFILGSFSALSMAPTNFWPAIFIGLSGLFYYTNKTVSPRKAFITGLLFSLGYFGFSLSWIGNALLVEDNPYWWAYPIAVSGLPVILSLFTGLALYIHKKLSSPEMSYATFISFCTAIFISEFARGHLFTGFPWNLYGYTWVNIPSITQIVALSDIYLLTLLTIFWATSPAFIIMVKSKQRYVTTVLVILSITTCAAYGVNRIKQYTSLQQGKIEIIVVQPNIKQSEKWKIENRANNFLSFIDMSKAQNNLSQNQNDAHYIIWPETAISQDLMNTPWVKEEIKQVLKSYKKPAYIMTGALRYNKETKAYYNSIITYDNNAEITQTYDKSHLVPFGEYMPLENIFDIAPIVGFNGFKKGAGEIQWKTTENITITPLICYEAIFPKPPLNNQSDMIINVTNDGWYGKSAGPYQHLVQTQFRAIEAGTPFVRSANTGISAIITPLGRIKTSIPLLQKGTITANLPKPLDNSLRSNYTNLAIIFILITLTYTCQYSRHKLTATK